MRVLHTADWHLGRRFDNVELTEEHNLFLDWLIRNLDIHRIALLIIAGDIFDSGTPSNTAVKQYFDFLWRVKTTACQAVVVIGGNHDSVSMLNAPADLLRYLNVYVVGGVPDNFGDQVIPISINGKTEVVVCAVPFLRDKDVRLSVSGESSSERESRIKEGIALHYRKLVPLIAQWKQANIPVIATGHLYAAGGKSSDSERDIHAGSLGQIGSEDFPAEFDYIALGHLHRPQLVNRHNHIRYSGAPVALGFSEADTPKMVLVLDFESGHLAGVQEVEVPVWRQLVRIRGNSETVKKELLKIEEVPKTLKAWVEVIVEADKSIPDMNGQVELLVKNKPFLDKFVLRQVVASRTRTIESENESLSLVDWTPESVFNKWCEELFGEDEDEIDELTGTFTEALEKMRQLEDKLVKA